MPDSQIDLVVFISGSVFEDKHTKRNVHKMFSAEQSMQKLKMQD